jgi:hypothetical protein
MPYLTRKGESKVKLNLSFLDPAMSIWRDQLKSVSLGRSYIWGTLRKLPMCDTFQSCVSMKPAQDLHLLQLLVLQGSPIRRAMRMTLPLECPSSEVACWLPVRDPDNGSVVEYRLTIPQALCLISREKGGGREDTEWEGE